MLASGPEDDALLLHEREPAIEMALLQLELGNAVAKQPADPVRALEDRHLVPGVIQLIGRREACGTGADDRDRLARCARTGGRGTIQPSWNARSTIESSMLLIVTGSSLMPSTHDPSHGAGQSRPVNSGKLLVACRRSIAALPLIARRRDRSSPE